MFDCNYFREICQCEQNILATCEFDNFLNDCTDFTTTTLYLSHACYSNTVAFYTDEHLTIIFLDSLNSLKYFHYLKRYACFFINEPEWEINVNQHPGIVLQMVMDKYALGRDKFQASPRTSFEAVLV